MNALDFSKLVFRAALTLLILTLILALLSFAGQNLGGLFEADFFVVKSAENTEPEIVEASVIENIPEQEEKIFIPQSVFLDIPFTSQAPFGNWEDLRQEDGCEEASVLMAMSWLGKWDLTPEKALQEIISISEYERALFGEFRETSLHDTAERILRGYFRYNNFEVRYNIDAQDIKMELQKGNAVIVAVNGRILANPFYTPPGPRDHMLVIQGYDAETHEFITNDPGTRRGEKFRYAEDLLVQSLQDYPTGNHEPISEVVSGMIAVRPF